MQPAIIETRENYERAQLRLLDLGRPVVDRPEEHEHVTLSRTMLEWDLRSAEFQAEPKRYV